MQYTAEIHNHLNINISSFESDKGQAYLNVIEAIIDALEGQGMATNEMDKEALKTLISQSVEVIRNNVGSKRSWNWRKQTLVEDIERAKDPIINEVVNKYLERKDKDGIALQSIESHEADISNGREICKSEGGMFGMKNVQRIPLEELELGGEIGV